MHASDKHFVIHHSPGFRRRRGLNWTALGFMYASYYVCRYSFKFATPGLQEEFGYSFSQLADIWAIWSLAYGTGQLINGLISDRIGGKKCMLIGAVCTIILNLTFGLTSLAGMFSTFALIYLVNGYFQAYGAPGMIKINAAWFHRTERGTFSGIFGGMIQLGKVGIGLLAPWMLAGMVVFGHALVAEGEWRWLFRVPPMLTICAALFLLFAVKETPDDAGFPGEIEDEIDNTEGVTVKVGEALKTIFKNPFVWFYAVAYASTGAVRHSSDQLSNLFFNDQLQLDMVANIPRLVVLTFFIEPWVGFLGSLISGIVSDKYYSGRRSPVAMVLYFITTGVIAVSAVLLLRGYLHPGTTGVIVACCIILMISFAVNSTHSLVGAAAPMDIGGKKMAGFASGVIDSFQYYGSAVALWITGLVLDAASDERRWFYWFAIMAGFGLVGAFAMMMLLRKQKRLKAKGFEAVG